VRAVNILLDPDARPVVGHRGASAHAPENTLEAFASALAAGAQALEFDVRVTADGVPVVHHDASVDRTTDGGGLVAAHSLAALKALDAGARFTADGGRSYPYRGRGVRVPTLDEVLGAFPGTPLIVEVKEPTASAATRAVLERHGAEGRCVVGAFARVALAAFRGSAFALSATRDQIARLLAAAVVGGRISAPPYRAISVPPSYRGVRLPLARFVRLLRPHGRTVHVWVVDEPRTAAALWEAGVQGVLTNDPAAIVAAQPARL
jgi:glycerophosphoryl diester phosphodiesterase